MAGTTPKPKQANKPEIKPTTASTLDSGAVNPVSEEGAVKVAEQTADEVISQFSNNLTEDFNQLEKTADDKEALEKAEMTQPVDDAILDTQAMMNSFRLAAQQAEQENKQIVKDDYNTRVFGGLTEATANIANLIGTMAGASNQTIKSPQAEWAQRSDAMRRERERTLDKYKAQMQTLKQQKDALDIKKMQAIRDYDKRKADEQYRTKKLAYDNERDLRNYNLKINQENRLAYSALASAAAKQMNAEGTGQFPDPLSFLAGYRQ